MQTGIAQKTASTIYSDASRINAPPLAVVVPSPGERRRSARWETDKPIRWRTHGGRRMMSGRVKQRSLQGMIIRISAEDTPAVGSHIHPSDQEMAVRHGFRCAVVRRVAEDCGGLNFVFTEILA